MARINIEDSLFKDGRFIDLAIKLGSRRSALGALMEAFIIAQEFYLSTDNDRLVPIKEWERQRIAPEIVEVGLAEKREHGIYVHGSDKQFGWLIQRSEAGKRNKGQKKETTVNDRSTEPNGSNPLPLTLSLSPSLTTNSSSDSFPGEVAKKPKPAKKVLQPEHQALNKRIWEAYLTSFRTRYSTDPLRNPKVNGIISQLATRLGVHAPLVVEFFLKHNEARYVRTLHAIELCLKDAEALHTQWRRGRSITEKDVKAFTNTANIVQLNSDIKVGGF